MKKSRKKSSGNRPRQDPDDLDLSSSKYQGTYEPSDSEDDYTQKEKMLIEKARSQPPRRTQSSKKAIMDLPSEDDDEDDDHGQYYNTPANYSGSEANEHDDDNMESDIEGQGDDGLNLPDQRAWGTKRRNYYNTDYVDQDYGGFDGEDAEAAELEEQEAREIQQRLAAELDDADFSLDVYSKKDEIKESQEKDRTAEELIKTDLSQLTTRQKLNLLQKESPELIGIVSEFREIMADVLKRLQPAMVLVHEDRVASPELAQYIRTKLHLCNNYSLNMGYYLLLRSQRLPVSSHPVIKRLLQYRQLLQRLQPLEEIASPKLDELLAAAESGNLPVPQKETNKEERKLKKKPKLLSVSRKAEEKNKEDGGDESQDDETNRPVSTGSKRKGKKEKDEKKEKTADFCPSAKKGKMPWQDSLDEEADIGAVPWEMDGLGSDGNTHDDDDNNEDAETEETGDVEEAKRAITWQMQKNKGLTPHRKKELRNPRVKNRNKFRKAKIRRKGQVREARTEVKRYGGEISGIKTTVSKSVKIK